VLTGPNVILTLQLAVITVTVLLGLSLIALARGNLRLHGRINTVFFVLTLVAVLGLELVIRLISPEVRDYFHGDEARHRALNIHLCFSVPSALFLPAMLYTGKSHRGVAHRALAVVFAALWIGTFVTGVFYLK
jgi:hypothetical protein